MRQKEWDIEKYGEIESEKEKESEKRKKKEKEGDWRMGERGRIRWRKGVKEKVKTRDVDRKINEICHHL